MSGAGRRRPSREGQAHRSSDPIFGAQPIQCGYRVLFTTYGGQEIKVGGESYLVMEESDVLAVIV